MVNIVKTMSRYHSAAEEMALLPMEPIYQSVRRTESTEILVFLPLSLLLEIITTRTECPGGPYGVPGGRTPLMDYTGRLRPKEVPFSGWRYIKR